jgi:hypothetical protein
VGQDAILSHIFGREEIMAKQKPAREEEFESPYDKPAHVTGVARGENVSQTRGGEAGRLQTGERGAGRPAGSSTPRDVTGINPDEMAPIDPQMVYMPPQ